MKAWVDSEIAILRQKCTKMKAWADSEIEGAVRRHFSRVTRLVTRFMMRFTLSKSITDRNWKAKWARHIRKITKESRFGWGFDYSVLPCGGSTWAARSAPSAAERATLAAHVAKNVAHGEENVAHVEQKCSPCATCCEFKKGFLPPLSSMLILKRQALFENDAFWT